MSSIIDIDRRFLRARKLKIEEAKKMVINCQEWRKTVEGVGIDALYDQIDPLDASFYIIYRVVVYSCWLFDQYPDRELVSKYWPFYYHKVRAWFILPPILLTKGVALQTDKVRLLWDCLVYYGWLGHEYLQEGHPVHIQAFGKLDVNACKNLLSSIDAANNSACYSTPKGGQRSTVESAPCQLWIRDPRSVSGLFKSQRLSNRRVLVSGRFERFQVGFSRLYM